MKPWSLKRWMRSVLIGLLCCCLAVTLQFPQAHGQAQVMGTTSTMLLQAGQTQYQAGRYADAAQSLGQAITAYRNAGQSLAEARTLGLQALALEKIGRFPEANQVIAESLLLLKELRQSSRGKAVAVGELNLVEAQVLSSQGKLLRAQGEAKAALESWKAAELLYKQEDDVTGILGSRINQIKALETLGFYRRADQQLEELAGEIQQLPDTSLKARGLLSLGNLLRLEGQLQESAERLKQGLALAQTDRHLRSQLLFSLANTLRLQANRSLSARDEEKSELNFQQAIAHYQAATELAEDPTEQVQIQLNQLSLLASRELNSKAYQTLVQQIAQLLPSLPVSRRSIYAKVNFAQQLMEHAAADVAANRQPGVKAGAKQPKRDRLDFDDIVLEKLLRQAVQQSQMLGDARSQSYALGTLGHWFERQRNWGKARSLTQQALSQAQQVNAPEIVYQWQWQLGRTIQASRSTALLTPQSKVDPDALASYQAAYGTLNMLRSDLVALTPDIQFSFRERVEPVYRELVDLLLRDPQQADLRQARDVIEDLQLAELDNFFRDACAQAKPTTIDDVDPNAAIVYSIILPDRLEIILKLPGQEDLRHYVQSTVSTDDVEQTVREFRRQLLRQSSGARQFKQASNQLYQWLIQPLETELELALSREDSVVKTLAFVLDGSLRSLPMAALYDGEHYLVERYAIALTPGLQLLEPQPLARANLKVLLGGVDNAPSFQLEGFSPLAYVPFEINQIQSQLSESKLLQESEFQKETINQQLNQHAYNVVHLATHGQFSSDPEQTFILDWNGRINAGEMDSLLRFSDPGRKTAVELLVLSACETAKGDSRAALGLAGMAIRAGARSTLATTWQVDDASTAKFMIEFYQRLSQTAQTKAEVLREVQLSFLRDFPGQYLDSPYYWAPFILVGNWL